MFLNDLARADQLAATWRDCNNALFEMPKDPDAAEVAGIEWYFDELDSLEADMIREGFLSDLPCEKPVDSYEPSVRHLFPF